MWCTHVFQNKKKYISSYTPLYAYNLSEQYVYFSLVYQFQEYFDGLIAYYDQYYEMITK